MPSTLGPLPPVMGMLTYGTLLSRSMFLPVYLTNIISQYYLSDFVFVMNSNALNYLVA